MIQITKSPVARQAPALTLTTLKFNAARAAAGRTGALDTPISSRCVPISSQAVECLSRAAHPAARSYARGCGQLPRRFCSPSPAKSRSASGRSRSACSSVQIQRTELNNPQTFAQRAACCDQLCRLRPLLRRRGQPCARAAEASQATAGGARSRVEQRNYTRSHSGCCILSSCCRHWHRCCSCPPEED